MSDEKPGETAPKPAEKPQTTAPSSAEKAGETTADGSGPPSAEEAMQRLRGDAAELSSTKFGEIAAEGIDRLAGAATVNVFQGDFSILGDFTAGSAGGTRRPTARRPASQPLDAEKLAEENDYFVAPAGFEQGVDTLSDRNLLILSGPARTGRRSRAVATLLGAQARAGIEPEVVRLNGSVLGNMSWRVPRARCGFLVIDQPGKGGKFTAETVNDTWLTYAAERLAEQESHLLVVTGPIRGALATASRRADFVLADLELPDPLEIVRKRVLGELLWDAEDLDARLATAGLEELLHERDDPRFAARAAAAVVEALRADTDLAAAVAKLRNPEEQVREWLEREPELIDVAFVLATAVLEGASYLSVADAAVQLFRALSGRSGVTSPRYLKDLMAERSWIECVGKPGDAEGTPTLRFKHARLRTVVLALTWFEFDGARAKILEWLKSLAGHTDVEVRARAAQAAGILASNDFEHGMHRYFLPWAATGSPALRQSAAYALNVAGTTGRHTDAAWSYVEQWTEFVTAGKARTNLLKTAGLAAGGQLGVDRPRRALRVLRTLAREGDWALLEPVSVSTKALLEAGRGEEVLEALLEWSEGSFAEDSKEKALSMFAFAVLPEDGENRQPLLLRTADRHRDALPELWGRALALDLVRPLALLALEAWVRIVDTDDTVRDSVLDVIGGIADRSDNDYDRLLHALHEWGVDADDPSAAAADFHDELLEAGEEAS